MFFGGMREALEWCYFLNFLTWQYWQFIALKNTFYHVFRKFKDLISGLDEKFHFF
jgi:hypothetical protein